MLLIIYRTHPERLILWYGVEPGDDDFNPILAREGLLKNYFLDVTSPKSKVTFNGHGICLGKIVVEEVS